jgi:hypothetical protein
MTWPRTLLHRHRADPGEREELANIIDEVMYEHGEVFGMHGPIDDIVQAILDAGYRRRS